MDTRDLALRAIVTKHVADVAAGAIKARRAELADAMASGDRVNVTAPDTEATDLGYVLRTKPKGTGTVTDRAKFTAWMATNYPGRVQVTLTLPAANLAEAIQVLYTHAPHLIDESPTVEPWAENEVLKCTEQAREACGPGGELDIPGVTYQPPGPGVITVKLSGDAAAAIERLWRAGRIDLGTGEVRELETAHVGGTTGDTL